MTAEPKSPQGLRGARRKGKFDPHAAPYVPRPQLPPLPSWAQQRYSEAAARDFPPAAANAPVPAQGAGTSTSPFSELFLAALDKELADFHGFMRLSPDERLLREKTTKKLTALAQQEYADSRLEVFGSWATDLALPVSDIDFTLCGVEATEASPLAHALQCAGFETQLIHSKVPIVRVFDRETGVHADISFNMNRAAASAANMRRLLRKHPHARQLIVTLKLVLKLANLNELYTGGLSSYALSLMVVSLLQQRERSAPPAPAGRDDSDEEELSSSEGSSIGYSDGQSQPEPEAGAPQPPARGAGRALVDFLEKFGTGEGAIDFEKLTVAVAQGGLVPREDSPCSAARQPSQLSLEDPLCPENDVAKGTFRFHEVREVFDRTLADLRLYAAQHSDYERTRNVHSLVKLPATPLLSVLPDIYSHPCYVRCAWPVPKPVAPQYSPYPVRWVPAAHAWGPRHAPPPPASDGLVPPSDDRHGLMGRGTAKRASDVKKVAVRTSN